MKKREANINTVIGIVSLIISMTTLVWIGGFQFAELKHEVHDMKEDIQGIKSDIRRIDDRLDRMETEFHQEFRQMDVRITTLEHRKP